MMKLNINTCLTLALYINRVTDAEKKRLNRIRTHNLIIKNNRQLEKSQENLNSNGKIPSTNTNTQMNQMLELSDKDFKAVIIKIFH